MATCAILAEELSRRFDGRLAVDRLSLAVYEGEVFGFLGPNGAGKTTTVRMLAGLIAPTSGRALIAGVDVVAEPQRVRSLVGVLTESPGLYEKLSVWQNLQFYADLYGLAPSTPQIERYLRLFDLWERRFDPVSALSKGMKQKLALARSLLHDPKVLFLDEPTAGLDPEAAKTVRDLIAALSQERRTIFLCTHNLHEAEQLCDRIGLIKQRLLKVGTPHQLKRELYGHQIVVDLKKPLESLDSQLNLPFVKGLRVEQTRLVIELENPQEQNPLLVRRLVELGAEIQFVREADRSLEDVYLQLVREESL
ncbi:MAG: ABC transporter ATP-binding protein [Candidatus Bipolaricaulota bacterium]|nr:ABC transporter ATP-binding protein [Candidatus Bipolaricaulota bacterium]MCS7275324.1 ABC transporter ATP-binding protein [Candidatus Bipolaricaulota bacterium]